jgi:hypothetical protein
MHRPLTTSLPLSRSLHSTPLLPMVSALFCSTALTQPFSFQSLPHSFYRHGGVPPSSHSGSPSLPRVSRGAVRARGTRRSPLVALDRIQVLLFHTLPNSFALPKNSTLFFSSDSRLFAKNTRGGGRGHSFAPAAHGTLAPERGSRITSHQSLPSSLSPVLSSSVKREIPV